MARARHLSTSFHDGASGVYEIYDTNTLDVLSLETFGRVDVKVTRSSDGRELRLSTTKPTDALNMRSLRLKSGATRTEDDPPVALSVDHYKLEVQGHR